MKKTQDQNTNNQSAKQATPVRVNNSLFLKASYILINNYPLFLLLVTLVSFGLFLPFLGYSGDDFSQIWLAYRVGSVQPFFQYNRPIYGQIFFTLSKILAPSPWQWHLSLIILRWLLALQIFYLLKTIKKFDERTPYFASLLFLIYPGALIYYMPATFIGVFIILFFLFCSFWLSLISLRKSKWSVWLKLLGGLLAIINLVSIEYFFFLELFRPFLIWSALEEKNSRQRFKRTIIESLPYLLIFILISAYRVFNQSDIVVFESPVLLTEFIANPINAINKLIPIAIKDVFRFGIMGWLNPLDPWRYINQQGKVTASLYFALVVISGLGIYLYYRLKLKGHLALGVTKKNILDLIALGIIALFLAGFAPWIAGLSPSIEPVLDNRFSLAFALGAALVCTGILLMIPKKTQISIILLSVISALSIGIHFFNANVYRYSWIEQKRFYWQLAWRFPSLPAPTTIVADYYTVKYQAENPLSAAINWMYFHESYGRTKNQIGYYIYYDENRKRLHQLVEPLPPMTNHLIGHSDYSTYHLLTIINQNKCLQVINPKTAEIDPTLTNPIIISGAKLSDLNGAYVEDKDHFAILDPAVFGPEPDHEWCYYFEKADLARSQQQWDTVIELLEEAEFNGYTPTSPSEKVVFLEAYLARGAWDQAITLSQQILDQDQGYLPIICLFWEESPAKNQESHQLMEEHFSCAEVAR